MLLLESIVTEQSFGLKQIFSRKKSMEKLSSLLGIDRKLPWSSGELQTLLIHLVVYDTVVTAFLIDLTSATTLH